MSDPEAILYKIDQKVMGFKVVRTDPMPKTDLYKFVPEAFSDDYIIGDSDYLENFPKHWTEHDIRQ